MYVTVTDDSQMYNALCGHNTVIHACIQNETFLVLTQVNLLDKYTFPDFNMYR